MPSNNMLFLPTAEAKQAQHKYKVIDRTKPASQATPTCIRDASIQTTAYGVIVNGVIVVIPPTMKTHTEHTRPVS